MKHISAYLGATLLLLGAASCDTDRLVSTGTPQTQYLTATAEAYAPLPATRTQVGEVGADGALSLLWSPGDRIGVFSAQAANVPFTNAADAPAATASFAGQLEGTPLYAYYPYAAGATDPQAIPVEIASEQTYADEGSIARYDVKAGEVTPSAGGYSLSLRQLAALVRFEFDLTGVETLSADERVQDVAIHQTETSVPMAGGFTFDLTRLDAGLTAGDASTDGITLRFVNPPAVGAKFTAYAVVAPGSHQGNEWCCVFTTDRHIVTFYTTALCDFEAGKYYTVPLNFEVLERNGATYEELPQEEPEEETANCYIVTETGEHSFKATVIGNGEKGIIKGAGFHTENPYINPQSAKLLWSTTKDFVKDVRLENGRVYYTTTQVTGNAVIAVYSGPDGQGDILWSWHIWGTEGVPQDEVYTNQAGETFLVMDRDLGAVRVGDNRCVQYQWGRKDPFKSDYAPPYIYEGGTTQVNVQRGWPVATIPGATIVDAIRHPAEIITSGNNTNRNWLGVANYYLWGDAGRELPDDLRDPRCAAGWNNQKTIYDPSPVGYRVANIFTFSGFTDMPGGSTGDVADLDNGVPLCLQRLDFLNYIKANNSEDWWFKKNEADTEGSCYPGIQARSGRTGDVETGYGVGGRWWAAEAYPDTNGEPAACYLKTDAWKNSAPIAPNSGNAIDTYARTNLLRDVHGVRCVRENSGN